MFETVVAVIEEHQLLPASGRVVVAVSGGADSLCLLHVLNRLCGPGKRYPTLTLHVAHLNHQLRGPESQADAHAVEQLAHSWGLAVTIGSVDVPALARREQRSIEEAARVARYRFLREVAQGDRIALAHHKDDQVETLLLHWLRGGGLASTTGMRYRQQDLIRPFLALSRKEIHAYCNQYQLIPLEDASNDDLQYLRNRIRHELLPLLAELNPGIRETLLRTAEVLQPDLAWIDEQVDRAWSETVLASANQRISVRIPLLRELSVSIQRHLLRRVTAHLCGGQSPLELRHYHLLEELMQRSSTIAPLVLHLPDHVRATRVQHMLTLERLPDSVEHEQQELLIGSEAALPVPGCVSVPGTSWYAQVELLPDDLLQMVLPALAWHDWETVWHLLPVTPHVVYVDADRVYGGDGAEPATAPLYVRTRRKGDRMQPLGMVHEKKVQDILVDKQIPRATREQIPLFFTATHCIWLAGIQLDERARLSATTRSILRLSIAGES